MRLPEPDNLGTIHIVGIGGIGMSAIAEGAGPWTKSNATRTATIITLPKKQKSMV